jgi:FkbM family methyltransferase
MGAGTMSVYRQLRRFIGRTLYKGRDLLLAPGRARRQRHVDGARVTGQAFIADIPTLGSQMLVDPEMFFAQVYVQGEYEPHLVQYLKGALRSGMVCVDAGANVGYFTVLMSRQIGPSGSVIAFEPTPRTFGVLEQNAKLNHLTNVTLEQCALSSHEGTLTFHVGPPGFEVYNSAGAITHPSASHQAFAEVQVGCVTLDHYLRQRGIPRVDLIKMDVEGAELSVLQGMEQTLLANPHATLVVEFADVTTEGFGYLAQDLGKWLVARGWRLAVVRRGGRLAGTAAEGKWTGQLVVATRPASSAEVVHR